jgi:hypothetical protein
MTVSMMTLLALGTVAAVVFRSDGDRPRLVGAPVPRTVASTTEPATTEPATNAVAPPTEAATTPLASAPTPQITTFYVDLDDCPGAGAGAVKIQVEWTTRNATRVTISIDGPNVFDAYDAEGTTTIPFDCASDSHTYTMIAYDRTGRASEPQSVTVPRHIA